MRVQSDLPPACRSQRAGLSDMLAPRRLPDVQAMSRYQLCYLES